MNSYKKNHAKFENIKYFIFNNNWPVKNFKFIVPEIRNTNTKRKKKHANDKSKSCKYICMYKHVSVMQVKYIRSLSKIEENFLLV